MLGQQQLLARRLVSGIQPIRIVQRRILGDRQARQGLAVGGSRTDEHILPGVIAEQAHIARGLLGRKHDKIAYHVVHGIPQQGCHARLILDIRNHLPHVAVKGAFQGGVLPAVEQCYLPALFQQSARYAGADYSRSADHKRLHCNASRCFLPSL